MAYYSKVTQGLFDAVKICLQSGNNVSQTAKFMKLSVDVVMMIRDAENLGEYKNAMAERSLRKKENRQIAAIKAKEAAKAEEKTEDKPELTIVEHRQIVKVEATQYMMEELRKTNELLTAISNKMAYIVEQLT